WADEVAHWTERASRLGAADVAADVVEPLEAHPDDGAVPLRRQLAVGDAIRAARRREQVLSAVLDPLHRHARVLRGQRDQRDVGIDARLDAERAADVRRHDEAQLVLGQPEHPRGERMHDERPHEVGPDGADTVGLPARDDPVRLDWCGAVFRKAEALAQHDVGLAERALGIPVHEPSMTGEVRADLVVQHRRIGLERFLRIDDGGQRFILDVDQLRRVLGQVSIARHDDRHRLADEPHLVGGRAVIVHGRRDADRERLRLPRDIVAGDHADHALGRARLRHVVPEDARVRVARAHDRRVVDVADRRMIVDVRSASGEETEILDALDRLADPAIAHERPRTLVSRPSQCQARAPLTSRRPAQPPARKTAQCPPPATAAPVIDARRLARGVLRLRPTRTSPSMTTAEIPGISPRASACSASGASDAAGASHTTRSAGWPMTSVAAAASRKARALLPVARAITVSGARSPSEASSHTLLSTPIGITPVPVGVSLATHTRNSAPASRASRKMKSADLRLPACTSCSAMSVSRTIVRSPSSSSEVVPPLTWPQTSGRRCNNTSCVIGLEPGIELPPLCDITHRPCFCARRTSGSPSRGCVYAPKPYLAWRTPCLVISAKSASLKPGSSTTEPALTFM